MNTDKILIKSNGSNYIKLSNNVILQSTVWLLETGTFINFNKIKEPEELLVNNLNYLESYNMPKDILLIGCGNSFVIPKFEIRSFINKCGFKLEWMINKSAYNTWNLIIQDNRPILGLFFL